MNSGLDITDVFTKKSNIEPMLKGGDVNQIREITESEVREAINHLRNGKTSKINKVLDEFLKYS